MSNYRQTANESGQGRYTIQRQWGAVFR